MTRSAPRDPVGIPWLLGTGLAAFLAQWASVALWVPPANVSAIWIPGGVLLGIALLTEPRRWPSLLGAGAVGVALLLLTLGLVPATTAILLGTITGLQTGAVALALRRMIHQPRFLGSRQEFLAYLAVVVVGGAVLASTLVIIAAWGLRFRPATFMTWRTFALAVVLGYLAMTPTVVLLAQELPLLREWRPRRRLEAAGLALLLALASGLVFSGTMDRLAVWAAFAIMFPPLLLWSALRFGTLGASASLLLVSVVSTATTSEGMGPFTGQSPGANTLSLQLFILGIGVPLLGLAVVLSEEKLAREELESSNTRTRELNRKLIAAREEEGSRIARELHDDVGQRLALLSIGLGRLRQSSGLDSESSAVPAVTKLQEQASDLARSLRHISHQLHPAVLDHAGLASALEHTCEEVRRATGLDVELVNRCDDSGIPPDVALCLYRVTQEALGNVIRHSGARRVSVVLWREAANLVLQVNDDGRGLGSAQPAGRPGLGLQSAAERVAAVGGLLTIESTGGTGTTIRAAIPQGGEQGA